MTSPVSRSPPWKDLNAPAMFRMVRPNVTPEQHGRLAEVRVGKTAYRVYDALSQMTPEATIQWLNQPRHEAAYQFRPSGPLRLTAWLRVEVVLSTFPVMADWQAPGDRLW